MHGNFSKARLLAAMAVVSAFAAGTLPLPKLALPDATGCSRYENASPGFTDRGAATCNMGGSSYC